MMQASSVKDRLQFIDAIRAYAILMMLQGHFVDTMLAYRYRDLENALYSTWFFMRGMTAPIFFTVTGLEVFASDGLCYIPMPFNANPENQKIFLEIRGQAASVRNLVVHQLRSAWR